MRPLLKKIEAVPTLTRFGRVAGIDGLLVEVTGADAVSSGGTVRLTSSSGELIPCVGGFGERRTFDGLCPDDQRTLSAACAPANRPPPESPARKENGGANLADGYEALEAVAGAGKGWA